MFRLIWSVQVLSKYGNAFTQIWVKCTNNDRWCRVLNLYLTTLNIQDNVTIYSYYNPLSSSIECILTALEYVHYIARVKYKKTHPGKLVDGVYSDG